MKCVIPVEHHSLLAKLYQETGVPLDRLPYTPHFEHLHAQFCAQAKLGVAPQKLWEQLMYLRKVNKLTKIGKRKTEVIYNP